MEELRFVTLDEVPRHRPPSFPPLFPSLDCITPPPLLPFRPYRRASLVQEFSFRRISTESPESLSVTIVLTPRSPTPV